MQKKEKIRRKIELITRLSMMVALSVIIGMFCKSFLNFGQGLFRITFENIPIIMSGIVLGPFAGVTVGTLSDLLSYFLSPQTYPPNLVVTLGSAMIGFLSGFISKYCIKKKGRVQIIVSGAVAHIIGSMIIKSIGLFQFYQWLVLWRVPTYMVIAPLEIFLICLLLSRRSFAKVVGYRGNKMNKEETLEYIHSINWCFCKPGLERITELCQRLNNPQDSLKFIHVAGTNGKGSFCSMLSSILIEQGYCVGLYTSPYIKVFNERMQVNGEMISDSELSAITEKIKPIADSMADKPTEFELVTSIALEYFKSHSCDYVILECGLGGRLDSTNVINTSVLSVITGIALDHTSILGDTIEKIAYEKAGIIKKSTPCLWCGEDSVAKEVITGVATEKNAPLYLVNRDSLVIKSLTMEGTVFDYDTFKDVKLSLLGSYQPVNAVNVLCAVKALREQGVNISDESVYHGLEKAKWSARFEKISDAPLIIFDGGHNPEGVDSCVESIKQYFGNDKVYVLTGVMKDKDYSYISSRISTVAERVFCITPNNSRALPSSEYAEQFKSLGIEAQGYNSVQEALEEAVKMAKENKKAIICTGSLYMYSEVDQALSLIAN
ncbi:MAG: folate family ECF transporter S component [Clostridia bacterium]|nr:folate family ECF transporter S component [Clostridia bacterium]